MIKNIFVLLLIFQFNSALGQKTLEKIVSEIQNDEAYSSTFSYYDDAGDRQGISIQNEFQILERLGLPAIEHAEYYLTGKYEVNNSIILFVSRYWETEDVHFALLLDKSLNLIDRLDETAYENAEGFYSARTYVDYNIVTTTTYNESRIPQYATKKYTITRDGFKPIMDHATVEIPAKSRIVDGATTNSITLIWDDYNHVLKNLSQVNDIDSMELEYRILVNDFWLQVAPIDSVHYFASVFDAFAKRQISFSTNNYHVMVNEISEEDFQAEEIKKSNKPEIEKITDLDEIEKLLSNQLLMEYNEEYDYYGIKSITADNGKEIDLYWEEFGVLAYFPTYHYLLLDGGHSTEWIIDMKNGDDDIDRIGNPDYYLPSPNGTFRLNGYYSGQSNIHFLEKNNTSGDPEYLFSFSSLLLLDFIESYFWKDDATIFVKIENEFYSIQMLKK